MIFFVIACGVIALIALSYFRQRRQLLCTQSNIASIWNLACDNPLLGSQTLSQISVFNDVMLCYLDQAADSLWPTVATKADRMRVVVQLAPRIAAQDENVSRADIDRLRKLQDRIAAC